MSLLLGNVRGANTPNKKKEIRSHIQSLGLAWAALVETMIKRANSTRKWNLKGSTLAGILTLGRHKKFMQPTKCYMLNALIQAGWWFILHLYMPSIWHHSVSTYGEIW